MVVALKGNAQPVVLFGLNSEGVIVPFEADTLTTALVTVDYAHHKIHNGDTFTVSYKTPDASPLADNGFIAIALTTTNKYVHLIGSVSCGGDAEVRFSENPTTASPTVLTPVNKSRRSTQTPSVYANRIGTVTDEGDLLLENFLPGGTSAASTGVIGQVRDEWDLDINTTSLVQLINRAGTSQPAAMVLEWYHVDE